MKTTIWIKKWELVVALVTIIPSIISLFNLEQLYFNRRWNDEILGLFITLCISTLILLAGKPWQKVSRFGSVARGISLAFTIITLLILFSLQFYWVRFQLIKFETIYANFQITHFGANENGLRQDLSFEFSNPNLVPYLIKDDTLLTQVMNSSAKAFRKQPQFAHIATAAWLQLGHSLDEIEDLADNEETMFSLLLAEADPQPWLNLKDIPKPTILTPKPAIGLYSGLITEQQGRKILSKILTKQDPQFLEPLMFALMSFPTLYTADQRAFLLTQWKQSFKELNDLVAKGYEIRNEVTAFLAPSKILNVYIDVEARAYYNPKFKTAPKMISHYLLGILHSNGIIANLVPKEQAELKIKIALTNFPHHQYMQIYYKYNEIPRKMHYTYNRPRRVFNPPPITYERVESDRQLLTAYVPAVAVEMSYQNKTLKLPKALLYWKYIHYDYKHNQILKPDIDKVSGRLWPFGLQDKNWNFISIND